MNKINKPIKFCKMHGLGNDFVVIDTIHQELSLKKHDISHWANRHLGIGFDQLLLIKTSNKADFACQIFNADGSEAEQCGNGMRCVGRFIVEEKLSNKKSFTIETLAGIIEVIVPDYDNIEVNMGLPILKQNVTLTLACSAEPIELSIVSLGNPHAIFRVPTIKKFPVAEWGYEISTHSAFPHGVNVGFMEIVDAHHIYLRTFERGAGETFACGTNSCAAVVTGIQQGWLHSPVNVELQYGNLRVEWIKNQSVRLEGPAVKVFEGLL